MYVFIDRMAAHQLRSGLLANARALLTAALVLLAFTAGARAQGLCRPAIAAVERATGVPDRLLQAVAIVESGRRDPDGGGVAPWPWTINVEGVGEVFDSKEQAIAAVTAHQARGARSIDVGCMQVNLKHHPDAFGSLHEAFDPATNAGYAARFLQRLLAQTGSWPRAVAGYHSLTPDIGEGYMRKVLAVWAQPERQPQRTPPRDTGSMLASANPRPGPTAPAAAPVAVTSPPASLPSPGRLLPQHASTGPTMTGRTLDSYRALPTRLLSGMGATRL